MCVFSFPVWQGQKEHGRRSDVKTAENQAWPHSVKSSTAQDSLRGMYRNSEILPKATEHASSNLERVPDLPKFCLSSNKDQLSVIDSLLGRA